LIINELCVFRILENLGETRSVSEGVAQRNWESLGETGRGSGKLGGAQRNWEKMGGSRRSWEKLRETGRGSEGGRGEGTEKAAYGFRQLFVIITCVV